MFLLQANGRRRPAHGATPQGAAANLCWAPAATIIDPRQWTRHPQPLRGAFGFVPFTFAIAPVPLHRKHLQSAGSSSLFASPEPSPLLPSPRPCAVVRRVCCSRPRSPRRAFTRLRLPSRAAPQIASRSADRPPAPAKPPPTLPQGMGLIHAARLTTSPSFASPSSAVAPTAAD